MTEKSSLRGGLYFTFFCALFGGIASSVGAPRFISWWFEPPVEIGVNCRQATEWAMHHFQWAQMTGAAGGAVIGLTLVLVWRRLRRSREKTLG
ncbi:MAG TPA: hypothetical protein VI895_11830 [Bdellovibrionota bacterium]|nr:hypothetical protein [Bdellovibrionota bacterium]